MQNHKQTWFFIFFLLISSGVSGGCHQFVGHNTISQQLFTPLARWSTLCKGNIFFQFCYKIQSSMHQIFTQMYLTVSIRPSHMERTNGLSHGPPSLNTFLHGTLQSLFKRYTRFPGPEKPPHLTFFSASNKIRLLEIDSPIFPHTGPTVNVHAVSINTGVPP